MRRTSFALALAALSMTAPGGAMAQDLGDILSGVAGAVINQEIDRNTFAAAQRQNTAAAYRDYLARFPKGAYRAEAERALSALSGTAVPAPSPSPAPGLPATAAQQEAALGLSRADRIQIQQQLSRLGHDSGVADGLWGRNTRAAISKWQEANRQSVTGYVTASQVALLREQAGVAGIVPPVGVPPGEDDKVEESLLSLTLAERRDIQRGLTALGYSTRGADGVFGANTRRAISAWQDAKGERPSGYLTADQLRQLRREAGI